MTDATPFIVLGPVGYAMAALFLLVSVVALAKLLWRDLTRFEIDFAAVVMFSLSTCCLILLFSGPEAVRGALAVAALFGTVTEAMRRLWPGRIGAGDPWLFAAFGLVAGPEHLKLVLAVTILLSLGTALCWSLARGKRLFRSMFPAALAFVPAMALALILRFPDAASLLPPLLVGYAIPPEDASRGCCPQWPSCSD